MLRERPAMPFTACRLPCALCWRSLDLHNPATSHACFAHPSPLFTWLPRSPPSLPGPPLILHKCPPPYALPLPTPPSRRPRPHPPTSLRPPFPRPHPLQVHRATSRLQRPPSVVEEFAEYLEFLGGLEKAIKEYDVEYGVVEAHYELMADFGIWVPPMQMAAYHTMEQDYQVRVWGHTSVGVAGWCCLDQAGRLVLTSSTLPHQEALPPPPIPLSPQAPHDAHLVQLCRTD